ncbi:unnamed protein product, partial [Mesorhabditis belari]|uniref:Uncharacterized protein n=1 Tax=Mesorhabditis belari TaxID=2138241 RepID=A0AAF3E7X4_9BILA
MATGVIAIEDLPVLQCLRIPPNLTLNDLQFEMGCLEKDQLSEGGKGGEIPQRLSHETSTCSPPKIRKPLTGVLKVAEDFPSPSLSGSSSIQKSNGPRFSEKLKTLISCKSSSLAMVLPSTSSDSPSIKPSNELRFSQSMDPNKQQCPSLCADFPQNSSETKELSATEEKVPFFYIYLALLFVILCLVAISVYNYYSSLKTYRPSTIFHLVSFLNRVDRFKANNSTRFP